MNIFQQIIYYFLEKQEKALSKKLSKHLKNSSSNKTTKTIVSKDVTVTFNAETEKSKELVKKNVTDIIRSCNNDPTKLLNFIESKGTKVIKIDNADKILAVIKEEEGLITELEGIEALYINIITNSGFSFRSKPMFIMRNGQIDPYYMAHQFYKWYALKMGLPGFDFMSQKIFKISLNSKPIKFFLNSSKSLSMILSYKTLTLFIFLFSILFLSVCLTVSTSAISGILFQTPYLYFYFLLFFIN